MSRWVLLGSRNDVEHLYRLEMALGYRTPRTSSGPKTDNRTAGDLRSKVVSILPDNTYYSNTSGTVSKV